MRRCFVGLCFCFRCGDLWVDLEMVILRLNCDLLIVGFGKVDVWIDGMKLVYLC